MAKIKQKTVKKAKRQKTQKVTQKATRHEIIVKVQQSQLPVIREEDLLPEKTGGKYMLPKTWLSEQQVLQMVQKTPAQHIYHRPAKGGGTWSYITQSYVVKILNYVFGWNWDFEVTEQGREQDQVWVKGKLTIKSPKGEQIIKTQFGRTDIKYRKGTKDMLDYGNDLKSAASDALKKCASLIGIGSDIYGKMEFKQEAGVEVQPQTLHKPIEDPKLSTIQEKIVLKSGQILDPDGKPGYKCADGDEIISEAEYIYSMRLFKKPLCREHQKDYGK